MIPFVCSSRTGLTKAVIEISTVVVSGEGSEKETLLEKGVRELFGMMNFLYFVCICPNSVSMYIIPQF